MLSLWTIILPLTTLYCAVQASRDYRRGDRLWAALGSLLALLLMLTPFQTHAVAVQLL